MFRSVDSKDLQRSLRSVGGGATTGSEPDALWEVGLNADSVLGLQGVTGLHQRLSNSLLTPWAIGSGRDV